MMRVTKDNLDLLVANVKGADYLQKELGIRTTLGSSEPVIRVDGMQKLAEIAAVTGKSIDRNAMAKRIRYQGVIFQCYESETRTRNGRRMPWA